MIVEFSAGSPWVEGASLEQAAAWFFENSTDGFALSRGGRILSVNRAWCAICRCEPHDAIGLTAYDVSHPDDHGSYPAADLALRTQGAIESEGRIRSGDGWTWVRTSVKRGLDGYAMIVIHDLTQQRAKHQEAADGLKAEELLRTAAGIISWRFNPDGGYYLSDRDFIAADKDVAAGANIPMSQVEDAIHPDDIDAFRLAIGTSIESGAAGELLYRRCLPNGHCVYYRSSWRGRGQLESGRWELMGIVQDMTEILEARDAAVHAEQAVKRADQLKSEFVANVSHEIRTPLNGVLA